MTTSADTARSIARQAAKAFAGHVLTQEGPDWSNERYEIDRSGDEPQCPKCVAAAVEAFKAQPMRCTRCDWTGTGAGVADDPEACPKCTYYSVEDIDTAKEPGQ